MLGMHFGAVEEKTNLDLKSVMYYSRGDVVLLTYLTVWCSMGIWSFLQNVCICMLVAVMRIVVEHLNSLRALEDLT